MFTLQNIRGALITMPHKFTTMALLDDVSPTARIAGACNAVRRIADSRLQGHMFDGEGLVRGLQRKGCTVAGARALVVDAGGVGSAIAASLAASGATAIGLFDTHAPSALALALAKRLCEHYPALSTDVGSNDPVGFDIVVNASPMGMNDGDPMPLDVSRIAPDAFVGEVVMKPQMTAFLQAAQARGRRFQIGADMLFEQIPAYLEFFGLPTTTPENLRAVARLAM